MSAFNAAINFGKEMIDLGASTLTRLVEIEFENFATLLEQQSVAAQKFANVRDIATLLALQREYRDDFWTDRRSALKTSMKALELATKRASQRWGELLNEGTAPPVARETRSAAIADDKVKSAAIADDKVKPAAIADDKERKGPLEHPRARPLNRAKRTAEARSKKRATENAMEGTAAGETSPKTASARPPSSVNTTPIVVRSREVPASDAELPDVAKTRAEQATPHVIAKKRKPRIRPGPKIQDR